MKSTFDVVIVGGGVASSAMASVLVRNGFSVGVIEREARFRDRIRGEGLHPWGVAEAHRIGLGELLERAHAQSLPIWQSYGDRGPKEPFHWADVSVDGHPEMGVRHPSLQEASLDLATEAGATVFRPARVAAIRPGRVPEVDLIADDQPLTLRARLVIGADGRRSLTRKAIGSGTIVDPPHHRIGGVLLSSFGMADDTTHEAAFPGGRAFVLPQGGGRARAYIVTSFERNQDVQEDHSGGLAVKFLAGLFPPHSWDGVEVAGPIAFFPNEDEWSERLSGEGVVLIGDAAGANDPSVGHGLSLAFRDVRVLTELLLESVDWQVAIEAFADARPVYFDTLRHHSRWLATLVTDEGTEADERRDRMAAARELDPSAGGFALIFARGPDGLVATDDSRRRFFGELQ